MRERTHRLADNTFSMRKVRFEAPRDLRSRKVQVREGCLRQHRFCRTATTTADAFCDVSAAMRCRRYDEKLVGAYEVKSAGNT